MTAVAPAPPSTPPSAPPRAPFRRWQLAVGAGFLGAVIALAGFIAAVSLWPAKKTPIPWSLVGTSDGGANIVVVARDTVRTGCGRPEARIVASPPDGPIRIRVDHVTYRCGQQINPRVAGDALAPAYTQLNVAGGMVLQVDGGLNGRAVAGPLVEPLRGPIHGQRDPFNPGTWVPASQAHWPVTPSVDRMTVAQAIALTRPLGFTIHADSPDRSRVITFENTDGFYPALGPGASKAARTIDVHTAPWKPTRVS